MSVNPKDQALALLRRGGHHATSFQTLEDGYTYWFDPEADAMVAYIEVASYRVVAGPPVAGPEDLGGACQRFSQASFAQGFRVLWFSVSEDFLQALQNQPDMDWTSIPIGEQPEWDPENYTLKGKPRRSLRAQVNRAGNKGVVVHSVSPQELADQPGKLRAQIELVLERWLAARKMSAMRFMVDLQPFTYPSERRYYIAEQGDRAVGFLAAIPVYARKGWFFEDVIRIPDAPNGTAEAMIHAAMQDAHDQQDAYMTLGLAPLAGVEDGPGPHRWLRWIMKRCWLHLGVLYHFPGLHSFKTRFRPDRWNTQHLVATPGRMGLREIHAVLLAFAGGGLVSFGIDSLRRLLERIPRQFWATALLGFALLLIPWTLLLALADGERWFGDPSIHTAWVVFDAVMVLALAGLSSLTRRASALARPLAFILAGATMTDLVLTTVQAFHLHREPSGGEALFLMAGMAGPALATTFLSLLAWAAPLTPLPPKRQRFGTNTHPKQ